MGYNTRRVTLQSLKSVCGIVHKGVLYKCQDVFHLVV